MNKDVDSPKTFEMNAAIATQSKPLVPSARTGFSVRNLAFKVFLSSFAGEAMSISPEYHSLRSFKFTRLDFSRPDVAS